jgi:glycosyltransferase involved in cell wall biosynthesis
MPTIHATPPERPSSIAGRDPVFGLIIPGGALNGATVRDVRLANGLSRRGFRVHVWWAMDRPRVQVLDSGVEQHWLFHGLRFAGRGFRGFRDRLGRLLSATIADEKRAHAVQTRPHVLSAIWHGYLRLVCDGVERDGRLLRRFARDVARADVTHLLPALAVLGPWAAAAKRLLAHRPRYLVTFQGYEIYVNYARQIGLEQQFYSRVVDLVAQSDWPAIAVSLDYLERIVEDIGVPRDQLVAIPPGVPAPDPMDRQLAIQRIREKFDSFDPNVPLVTYVGRRDTEKGLDLLLYATKILRATGHKLQVHICGPTAFGAEYANACHQIAAELRTDVEFRRRIGDKLRSALFAVSRFVVYPSIHREPFGMVPVEAMACGTPAIVPDYGGVATAISANGEVAGLHFRAWDSGHLAQQMARLLEDDELYRRLSQAGPRVADHYSVSQLVDRVLKHVEVVPREQIECGAGEKSKERTILKIGDFPRKRESSSGTGRQTLADSA